MNANSARRNPSSISNAPVSLGVRPMRLAMRDSRCSCCGSSRLLMTLVLGIMHYCKQRKHCNSHRDFVNANSVILFGPISNSPLNL
jgi:hypothetical protein